MTNLQKLELEQSRKKQRIRELLKLDTLTDEQRSELDELTNRVEQIEVERRAAIAVDDSTTIENDNTGEGGEFRALAGRVEFRNYVQRSANQGILTGAELEFNQALNLGNNAIPWHTLDPNAQQTEHRADAATEAIETDRTPRPILQRVFNLSYINFFGLDMVQVPTGTASFPVLQSGANPEQAAKAAEVDAEAAQFQGNDLKPLRLSAAYLIGREDLAEMGRLQNSLQTDLRDSFTAQMNYLCINGTGVAPNPQGILAATAAPADPMAADEGTFSALIRLYIGLVDGIHAGGLENVKAVLGAGTYKALAGTFQANDGTSALAALKNQGFSCRTSAHVPPGANANIGLAVACLTMGAMGAVAIPVWDSYELVIDRSSLAKTGQVRLTGIALWNFKVLRAANFKQVKNWIT